jgi:hypothetical protein
MSEAIEKVNVEELAEWLDVISWLFTRPASLLGCCNSILA